MTADKAWKSYLNRAGEAIVVSGVLVREDISEKTKGLIKASSIDKLPPGQKPSHTIEQGRQPK